MDTVAEKHEATGRSLAAQAPAEQIPAAQVDNASLMSAIIAAGSTPGVNVENVERMMAMYERLEAKKAERAFNDAMTDAQTEMRPVAADANNPQTKSKYATYHALDKALRPIYTKYGFSPSYDTDDSPKPDHIRVLCYLSHRSGHTRTYKVDMPCDGKGAKGGDVMTKTHAAGAAMSYGQRYLLKGMFNITIGEDDDGNGASDQHGNISDDQAQTIRDLIARYDGDIEALCKYMGVEAVPDIQKKDYNKAITAINDWAARKAAAKQKAAAK